MLLMEKGKIKSDTVSIINILKGFGEQYHALVEKENITNRKLAQLFQQQQKQLQSIKLSQAEFIENSKKLEVEAILQESLRLEKLRQQQQHEELLKSQAIITNKQSDNNIDTSNNNKSKDHIDINQFNRSDLKNSNDLSTIISENESKFSTIIPDSTEKRSLPSKTSSFNDIEILQKIENGFKSNYLSAEISNIIQIVKESIEVILLALSGNSEYQMNSSDTFSALTRAIKVITNIMPLLIKQGTQNLIQFFIIIFEYVIHTIIIMTESSNDNPLIEDKLLMLSTFIHGIFHHLQQNLASQLAILFRGLVFRSNNICIPVIDIHSTKLNNIRIQNINSITFVAGMCNLSFTSDITCPFDVIFGWKWLTCMLYELQMISQDKSSISNLNIYTESGIPNILEQFLKVCGQRLMAEYTHEYLGLLEKFQATITKLISVVDNKSWKSVSNILKTILKSKRSSGRCFQYKEPHVIEAFFIRCHVDDIREMSAEMDLEDKNKGQTIRFLVNKAFNRLDVTPESAVEVADTLLQHIVGVGANEQMLGYTLNRMSTLLIDRTKSLNITSEGQTTKLARVACEISRRQPQLRELLKSQFYYCCPLVIPRYPESGSNIEECDSNDFRQEFRYILKTATQGTGSHSTTGQMHEDEGGSEQIWETNDDWLDRMGKILAVFADIIVLSSEISNNNNAGKSRDKSSSLFSLEDGWAWLAHLTNMACGRTKQPFYAAETFDIFLRITSPILFQKYGNQYLKLLKVIKKYVLPTLRDEGSRKVKNSIERLHSLLENALDMNPPQFLSVISK